MTDEMRAELRRDLATMVACAELPGAFAGPAEVVHDQILASAYRSWAVGVCVPFDTEPTSQLPPPSLTTAQQLALSVLLGDDIPLGVLLSACEDAGVFADGLAGEIANKAMAQERERIAAVCDGCAEACQLGVLSGSDDSRTRQNVYRNIAATARKLT